MQLTTNPLNQKNNMFIALLTLKVLCKYWPNYQQHLIQKVDRFSRLLSYRSVQGGTKTDERTVLSEYFRRTWNASEVV